MSYFHVTLVRAHLSYTGCYKKTPGRLIWCKLKTTVFTRPAFTFSESSYFNLNFGIKQSKIGWKLAEKLLPKAKNSGHVEDRRPVFFKIFTNLKQQYCFIKVHWSIKVSWYWKYTIVLLSYEVNEAFCCTKGLCERKNCDGYRYHFYGVDNYTDVIENFQWGNYVYKWQT